MSKGRKLYIVGDISWESYKDFTKELSQLECKGKKSIVLELASDGGDAYAALAFSARIRLSAAPIVIYAMGNVASAATLILASGHKRYMSKECWAMTHEDQGTAEGSVSFRQIELDQSERLELQWNMLLEEYTKTSAPKWAKWNKKTTYMTAEECLKAGLIDTII